MYILNYEVCDELHETVEEFSQPFTSVENALQEIKDSVKDSSRVILADHSSDDIKIFRWLHVECKDQKRDHYYYKLNELVKVDTNQPLH